MATDGIYIHELNDLGREPISSDYLAVDDGTDAGKVSASKFAQPVLKLTQTAFSSLPITITNSNITEDMVVVNSVLGTPSAQTGDWTVTTSNGSLTVAGSISGSTTLTLYLARSR